MVSLSIKGKGTDAASNRSLEVLREEVVPATVGKLDNPEVAVGGMTAWSKDFLDTMKSHLPIVFGFVLALAFILLLVTFRSIVVPIKAIILNLLSVGAAYGVLTLVFQDGHGEKALGFTSVGGITPWLPLFLFVVLFGLSMDYHVFVLSKVRELVDRGMSTERAVAEGIKSTAGVITGAAAVMVVTFAAFATGSDQQMKQLGVGLAVAILIDATIVRAVLLPATMKLLGERNWWLPKRLSWLPKFEHEPEVAPAAARRRRRQHAERPRIARPLSRGWGSPHPGTPVRPHGIGRAEPATRWRAQPVPSLPPEELPPMQSQSFAARAGSWSAQHRKTAILGWLAFVILATVLGGMVGTKTLADEDNGNGESKRGDQDRRGADFPEQTGETVLVQGKAARQGRRSSLHRRRRRRRRAPRATKGVDKVESPLAKGNEGQRLRGRPLGARDVRDPGDEDEVTEDARRGAARHRRRSSRRPPRRCSSASSATRAPTRRSAKAFEEDFQKAEVLSLPITLVILIVAFGALVAAGVPLLLGAPP